MPRSVGDRCDVLVRGAGPAGAVVAALLATRGRATTLLVRDVPAAGPPEETVLPEAAPLLRRLGLADLAAGADRRGTPRHGVLWGDDVMRWRPLGDGGPGWKLPRRAFDSDLRAFAATRGVSVVASPDAAPVARHTVLAAGKHGRASHVRPIATDALPPTRALWTRVARRGAFADATVIEAVPDGWIWWLPLAGGDVAVTLFCDGDAARERGPRAVWDDALRDARGPARGVDSPPLRGVDATPRLRADDGPAWFAGDAASTIDPLSSQGIEKSLASAEDVALTLETMLSRPDDVAAEVELRARRRGWERRLFRAHADRALAYYARETRFADRPFWARRHAEAVARAAAATAAPTDRPLVRAPDLREGRAWRRVGDALAPFAGVRRADDDEARDLAAGLPIAALLPLFERPARVADALADAARAPRLVLATAGAVRAAIDALYSEGFLVAAPVASR